MYTLGMDVRWAPDWMFNLSYRTSDSTRVYKKDQYYITSDKGDYKDRVTSELHGYHFDQLQASWEGKLQKWGVAHDIVTGFMSQNLTSTSSAVTPKTYLGTGNLYAPTIINVSSINWSGGTYQDEATRQEAVFFSDTVKFNDNWSVLAGARYNRFNENAYNTKNVVTASYPANRTTPTVALMFKPAADTTLYASYVEAMEMASNAPASTVNANQTFAPIKSKQAEAGIKTERSWWNASAALFQIKRGAQYTNAANVFVADGETKYQGLEVNSVVQASKTCPSKAASCCSTPRWKMLRPATAASALSVRRAVRLRYRPPGAKCCRASPCTPVHNIWASCRSMRPMSTRCPAPRCSMRASTTVTATSARWSACAPTSPTSPTASTGPTIRRTT
jgi:iron complex outermembrane receptor protein